ncbi:unnamed protein product [Clonostachys rosea]|uniref:NACHT-NTPase and P-loop NTPases N-terminal domain-containing protein n=1 Tax=Bionectria ochroleuca TaxID=29856 RepID=A0ABY6UW01_BIOOC|nr:unnamed protein product [Clonostachys rosea]
MSSSSREKQRAVDALEDVIRLFKRATTEYCDKIQEQPDLHEAFPVVAKDISFLHKVLEEIHSLLGPDAEEPQEIKERYAQIKFVADELCKPIKYIADLYESVCDVKAENRANAYRKAIRQCGNKRIEKIMLEMLERAAEITVTPLVGADQVKQLQLAIEQIKNLPSSLEEDEIVGSFTMNNYGSGTQLHHGGKGNQNHCTGGFNVNGTNNGATYNLVPDREPKEKKADEGKWDEY